MRTSTMAINIPRTPMRLVATLFDTRTRLVHYRSFLYTG